MRRTKWVVLAPLALLGILAFIAIGGVVVQLLWNWLLPPLLGAPELTVWQALGLLALCRILFGGFGSHRSGTGGRVSHRVSERISERMAERMGERWDQMSPEERERFRSRIWKRCGADPSTGEDKEGEASGARG